MKALVLFSGGLDSTTALALAISKYGSDNVIALSIYYGQKHDKEIESAKKVVAYYCVEHKILDLNEVFNDSSCSLLKGRKDIPLKDYSSQIKENNGHPVSTYVPFRNGLFLSNAAAIAICNNCSEIYYGAHADDSIGNAYPDTSEAFNDAINLAIYIGSGNSVKVVAPFINKSKAEVVKIGSKLKVPYELTWSCYEGRKYSCGKCATCIDRKKAFKLNGLLDPLKYED